MKQADVEVMQAEFYDLPLVRLTCPRCGKHSGWTGEQALLIAWELMHDCKKARGS